MSFSKDTLLSELTIGQLEQFILNIQKNLSSTPTSANYLNTIEAAAFIRKSPEALRQIVYNRKIKSLKRGNNLLFLKSDLIDWLESGRKPAYNDIISSADNLLKATNNANKNGRKKN